MVKAYLRYELASSWGVLASNSDICCTHDGAHLVTAALENVNIWNVKRTLDVARRGLAGWRVGGALARGPAVAPAQPSVNFARAS